jgi:hypothetical protein
MMNTRFDTPKPLVLRFPAAGQDSGQNSHGRKMRRLTGFLRRSSTVQVRGDQMTDREMRLSPIS